MKFHISGLVKRPEGKKLERVNFELDITELSQLDDLAKTKVKDEYNGELIDYVATILKN